MGGRRRQLFVVIRSCRMTHVCFPRQVKRKVERKVERKASVSHKQRLHGHSPKELYLQRNEVGESELNEQDLAVIHSMAAWSKHFIELHD